MKTKQLLITGILVAGAGLLMNQKIGATIFSPSDLSNHAVAKSPRALEDFPWLARQASSTTYSTPKIFSTLAQNPSFAASPRIREQYPQFVGSIQPQREDYSAGNLHVTELNRVAANSALAASPRMKEAFPQLSHGYFSPVAKDAFNVAPVK
jgi:hypothetical protein